MVREKLLRVLAVLVCVIAVLHITAIVFYLYWTFWWYDIPLHFLGGVFIALFILWVRFFSGYLGTPPVPSVFCVFRFALLGVLAVGVGWEGFERLVGHTWSAEGYWLDTSIDLALDMAGGAVGSFLFLKHYVFHGA